MDHFTKRARNAWMFISNCLRPSPWLLHHGLKENLKRAWNNIHVQYFILFFIVGIQPGVADSKITEPVPFVACEEDGQVGILNPPPHSSNQVFLPIPLARELSLYATADIEVLAPRGWSCFGRYGSSGAQIMVSKLQYKASDSFGSSFRVAGPAVEYVVVSGETSGRFAMLIIISRVFPSEMAFVDQTTAEYPEFRQSLHFGPYPDDQLHYIDPRRLEFHTPGNTEGLGPVDKPIQAAARPERLWRCNTAVTTGVMRRSAGAIGKQRISGIHGRFRKES